MSVTLRTCLIAAFWLCMSAPALAEGKFGGLLGYSFGTLQRETPETYQTFTAQGNVGYSFSSFYAHTFFQHSNLAYTAGDYVYEGIHSMSGLGIGYERFTNKETKRGKISAMLQVPIASAFIVVSESSGTVNDSTYVHSTLSTLSGGVGAQLLAGYEVLVIGRGGRSRLNENFYYGLMVGYLSHTFANQSTRIKTNNSDLAPVSPGSEAVTYKISVLSLNMTIAYDL